jgi:hypothetical protein
MPSVRRAHIGLRARLADETRTRGVIEGGRHRWVGSGGPGNSRSSGPFGRSGIPRRLCVPFRRFGRSVPLVSRSAFASPTPPSLLPNPRKDVCRSAAHLGRRPERIRLRRSGVVPTDAEVDEVLVEQADHLLDDTVSVLVTNALQTSSGRLVFGRNAGSEVEPGTVASRVTPRPARPEPLSPSNPRIPFPIRTNGRLHRGRFGPNATV